MTQADSHQAASWRGVRLRDHDPNDPKPTADSVRLRARGCALAADGEGVGGVGVQGQTTPRVLLR